MSWASTLKMITPWLAEKAARHWGLENLELVARSANAVFRASLGSQTVYLRMIHCEQRDEEFLAAGIDWARHYHLEIFLRGYQSIRACNPTRVSQYIRIRALLMLAWDMQDGTGQFLEIGRRLVLGNEFLTNRTDRFG